MLYKCGEYLHMWVCERENLVYIDVFVFYSQSVHMQRLKCKLKIFWSLFILIYLIIDCAKISISTSHLILTCSISAIMV